MAPALVEASAAPKRSSVAKSGPQLLPIVLPQRAFNIALKSQFTYKDNLDILEPDKTIRPYAEFDQQGVNHYFLNKPHHTAMNCPLNYEHQIDKEDSNATKFETSSQIPTDDSRVPHPNSGNQEKLSSVNIQERSRKSSRKLGELGSRVEALSKQLKSIQSQWIGCLSVETLTNQTKNQRVKKHQIGPLQKIKSPYLAKLTTNHRTSLEDVNLPINKCQPILRNHPESASTLSKLAHTSSLIKNQESDTDEESELECNLRPPPTRNKKKKEKLPPPTSSVSKWKQDRAEIGSQCSWLNLKMLNLDKSISKYANLYTDLRSSRGKVELALQTSQHETSQHETSQHEPTSISSSRSTKVEEPAESSTLDISSQNCSSARTRPVKSTPKHSYIRAESFEGRAAAGTSPAAGAQIEHSPSSVVVGKCPFPSSVVVGGCRLCSEAQAVGSQPPVNVIASRLDHSYHANLSEPADVPLSLHLEKVFHTSRINTKLKKNKFAKAKKKVRPSDLPEPPLDTKAKAKKATAAKLKSRRESNRSKSVEHSDTHPHKRASAKDRLRGIPDSKIRKMSESLHLDAVKANSPHSERSSPLLSQSMPSGKLTNQISKKKHKGADYDINNIVIPMSVAAATRVERIQYKEIPTPGWRSVSNLSTPMPTPSTPMAPGWRSVPHNNHFDTEDGEEDEGEESDLESTDDEALTQRHAKCEVDERKRFSWDVVAPNSGRRRGGAQRQSSECNTPDGFHSPHIPQEELQAYLHQRFSSHPITPRPYPTTPLVESPLVTPTATAHRPLTRHQATQLDAYLEEERERCWPQRRFPLTETEHRKVLEGAAKREERSSLAAAVENHNSHDSSSVPSPMAAAALDSKSASAILDSKLHGLRSRVSSSQNSSADSSFSPLNQSVYTSPPQILSTTSLHSFPDHLNSAAALVKPLLPKRVLESNGDDSGSGHNFSPLFFKSPSMTPIQSPTPAHTPTSLRSGATSPVSISPQLSNCSSTDNIHDACSSTENVADTADTWTVKLIAGTEQSPSIVSLENACIDQAASISDLKAAAAAALEHSSLPLITTLAHNSAADADSDTVDAAVDFRDNDDGDFPSDPVTSQSSNSSGAGIVLRLEKK